MMGSAAERGENVSFRGRQGGLSRRRRERKQIVDKRRPQPPWLLQSEQAQGVCTRWASLGSPMRLLLRGREREFLPLVDGLPEPSVHCTARMNRTYQTGHSRQILCGTETSGQHAGNARGPNLLTAFPSSLFGQRRAGGLRPFPRCMMRSATEEACCITASLQAEPYPAHGRALGNWRSRLSCMSSLGIRSQGTPWEQDEAG